MKRNRNVNVNNQVEQIKQITNDAIRESRVAIARGYNTIETIVEQIKFAVDLRGLSQDLLRDGARIALGLPATDVDAYGHVVNTYEP